MTSVVGVKADLMTFEGDNFIVFTNFPLKLSSAMSHLGLSAKLENLFSSCHLSTIITTTVYRLLCYSVELTKRDRELYFTERRFPFFVEPNDFRNHERVLSENFRFAGHSYPRAQIWNFSPRS